MSYMQYEPDSAYFLYGGKTNYIRGYGDEYNQNLSWMETKRTFGFFTVWTTNEVCYST